MSSDADSDFASALCAFAASPVDHKQAEALVTLLKQVVSDAVAEHCKLTVQNVSSIVSHSEAASLAQNEQIIMLLSDLNNSSQGGGVAKSKPASGGSLGKPRINTFFVGRCADPEFRKLGQKIFDSVVASSESGDGSSKYWSGIGKKVYSLISKSKDPEHKEFLEVVRRMLQDEYDSNRDGVIDVPDDVSEAGSVSEPSSGKIPAAEPPASCADADADADADSSPASTPEPVRKKPASKSKKKSAKK